jgi:hypothetical protein
VIQQIIKGSSEIRGETRTELVDKDAAKSLPDDSPDGGQ